jgi:hypothetical protein
MSWLKEKKPTPEVIMERIVRYFHVKGRPCFIGGISLETGMQLDKTHAAIEVLVDRGVLRHATEEEIHKLDGRSDSYVYALTGPIDPKLAFRP